MSQAYQADYLYVQPKNRWQYGIDCTIIILISIIFYWLMMPHFAITTPDEARYAEVAREMAANHNYLIPRLNGIIFIDKPPMFYWITAFFLHVFGSSVEVARSVTSIAALGISWSLYHIGYQQQQRRTGLLAAIIFLASPISLLMAHFINMDMLVASFIALSMCCFISSNIESKPRRGWLYAAYIFTACAILSKGLIGIVIPAMAIGSWIFFSGRWDVIKKMALPSGLACCLLLSAPWFILMQIHIADFSHFFFYSQQVGRYLSNNLNDKNPAWFYPAIIIAAFIVWIPSLITSLGQQLHSIISRRLDLTTLLMMCWAISTTVFFSIPKSKTLGYILPAIVPCAWLIANKLANTRKTNSIQYWQAYYWLALAIIIALASVLYHNIIPKYLILGISTTCLWLLLCGIMFILPAGKKIYGIGISCMLLASCLFNSWLATQAVAHSSDAQRHSIAPLSNTIKTTLTSSDQLISLNNFYYDLPFILQQPVKIVSTQKTQPITINDNWQGQLYEGLQIEPSNKWFAQWQNWRQKVLSKTQDKHIYIITEKENMPLLQRYKTKMIQQYKNTVFLRITNNKTNRHRQ